MSAVWMAVLRRDVLVWRRRRLQTLMRLLGGLVTVVFLRYLSRHVAGAGGADAYYVFAVGGVVASELLTRLTATIARVVRDEQLAGTLEATLGGTAGEGALIVAGAIFPLLEGTLVAAAQLALAAGLGMPLVAANVGAALVPLVIAALGFVGLGLLSASFVVRFQRGEPTAAVLALTGYLFAGVFFPPDALPWALRWISYLLPLTYAVRSVRAGLQGSALATGDLTALALFAALVVPLGLLAQRAAVAHGRRTGSLATW